MSTRPDPRGSGAVEVMEVATRNGIIPGSVGLLKTSDRCSTQIAKMTIDPEFVELAADVVHIIILSSIV